MRFTCLIALVFVMFFVCISTASVNLISPDDMNLTHASTATFFCNATDDQNVFSVSLYSNINGNFSLNATKNIMELDADSATTLLCHFNNTYTCTDGTQGINSSSSFADGKFLEGILVNDSDTLRYPTPGKMSLSAGTVELWTNVGFDPASDTAYFFATQDQSNDVEIYTDGAGSLYASIFGVGGAAMGEQDDAYASIAGWSQGEWHHIAAVWNTSSLPMVNLFVDGSNQSTTTNDPSNIETVGSPGQYMYVGSSSTGSLQSNSIIDELRMSDISRTPDEINASYLRGAGNHSNEISNFTISVPDGIFSWNCLATNNESGVNFASSNFTLYVDNHTAPSVNSVTFAPNATDDVDPGSVLNFTVNVTDLTNVSSVVFQYRYDADWINLTMSNLSRDLWNASITTNGLDRAYQYRIFSNDTRRIENTTATSYINSTLDYTWRITPINMTAYGIISTTSPIGILTVNNTGDDTLNIDISDDWPIIDIFYNTTNPFSLAAKSVMYINVTGKFAETDSTGSMTVTLTATPSDPGKTAAPASNSTVVSMISYGGGPYIEVSSVSSPNNILQGSTANLSVTYRNTGNETAYNVTLNWSLPAGWTNESGSVSTFIDNISNRSATNTSIITAILNSSAESGTVSVCANITVNYNATYSSCKSISVSCSGTDGICGIGCFSTNDIDCPVPVSVTTGGGGSQPSIEMTSAKYGIKVTTINRTDVYRGNRTSIAVLVSNTEKLTVINSIKLSVYGYPQSQIITMPPSDGNLSYGASRRFILYVNVPEYEEFGEHNITIEASGYSKRTDSSKETKVTASAGTVLFVHSTIEDTAKAAVKDAENAVIALADAGIVDNEIENSLKAAQQSMESLDYDTAKALSEEIIKTAGTAISAKNSINTLTGLIDEAKSYGINATETQKLQSLAVLAFDRGDYKRSEERAITGMAVYKNEAEGSIIQAKIFARYGPYSPFIILGLMVTGVVSFRKIRSRKLKKCLHKLEKEERSILSLLRDSQEKTFISNKMNKWEYEEVKKKYNNRLAAITREMTDIKCRTEKKGAKAVITREIEDLQRKRFEESKISKELYKKTMQQLNRELTRAGKRTKKTLVVIFFALILSNAAFAAADASASAALETAQIRIDEMKQMELPITRANDTLAEAKVLFDKGDYMASLSMSNYVETIKDMAVEDYNLIDTAESKIEEAKLSGIDVAEEEAAFSRALEMFESELFEDSKAALIGVVNSIDEKEASHSLGGVLAASSRGNVLSYIYENRSSIGLTGLIVTIGAIIITKITESPRRKIKIRRLNAKKIRIEDSIKALQKRYFDERNMTKTEYMLQLRKYRGDMAVVKKNIEVLSKR
ncbi:MAG TPA: LamG-like jellyroll fold domain-containing protein [archaeon]|nr:LamG-like jellyroll fold domain-containing protein [archaeon]